MRQQRTTTNTNTVLICFIIAALLLLVLLFTCNTQKNIRTTHPIPAVVPASIGLPQMLSSDNILKHTAYTICYSKQNKQASWVAYLQTGQHSANATEVRLDHFNPDPLANFTTAIDADYAGQNFDRGHMAPAEDMAWSKTTMEESFYYTNVSPQRPAFNRGVWKRLENLLRYWSEAYDSIYIVTGPVLTNGLPSIGPDKVSVPALYYKVVLEYNQKGTKAIGFILPNEASAATLQSFAVPVDSVEHLTGINFFYTLPDDMEEKLESHIDVSKWHWKKVKQ